MSIHGVHVGPTQVFRLSGECLYPLSLLPLPAGGFLTPFPVGVAVNMVEVRLLSRPSGHALPLASSVWSHPVLRKTDSQ